jgi:prefoldin subunit 5
VTGVHGDMMHQECEKSDNHIGAIYDKLHQIDKRVTVVEDTMQELTEIKTDIHSIKTLLEQGKGAFNFIKFLIYVAAPISAFIFWWNEHVH